MRDAVIVSAVRTAVGKAPKGTLRDTRPDEMGAAVIKEALARVPGLDMAEIEDVIMGCAMPEAEQGMNVARAAAIRAGLPVGTSAMTINRFCSSGLQSIAMAADRDSHRRRGSDRRRRPGNDVDDSDGRPHHSSQSVSRRTLSGFLSEHGTGNRERGAQVRTSLARSRTSLLCVRISARRPHSMPTSSRMRRCR